MTDPHHDPVQPASAGPEAGDAVPASPDPAPAYAAPGAYGPPPYPTQHLPHGGYGYQAPPQVQYFLPPGRPLPRRTWQRSSRPWVRGVSAVAGVLLLVGAIAAVTIGWLGTQQFTATGAVQVDCATGRGLGQPSVRARDAVRIYDAESGDLLVSTKLDRKLVAKGGAGACYAVFSVDGVPDESNGYLLQIGDGFSRLMTRDALESGVLLT